jgi:putative hydrolase of the HAD superfamily
LIPRDDTITTITTLKSQGYTLGLISNCSPEVPLLWGRTPFAGLFDVPVFSCAVGYRKPDPRIYEIALERLQKKPRECIFVADGDSGELAAAQKLGITAVCLYIPEERGDDYLYLDKEEWHRAKIASLSEILELVK